MLKTKTMKNFDVLMAEDKQGTLNLIKMLYESKNRKAKMYFHSTSIFFIVSLSLTFLYTELLTYMFFWFATTVYSILGLVLAFKAHKVARGYKLIIDTYNN